MPWLNELLFKNTTEREIWQEKEFWNAWKIVSKQNKIYGIDTNKYGVYNILAAGRPSGNSTWLKSRSDMSRRKPRLLGFSVGKMNTVITSYFRSYPQNESAHGCDPT